MGRGMLITAMGAIIIFGMVQLGLVNQKQMIVENSAQYAKVNHARNTALTGIQLAMEQINANKSWHPKQGNPWKQKIYDAEVSIYYDLTGVGSGSLDSDTLVMYSTANYFGDEATIVSTFTRSSLDFVPEFKSAMSFATGNFNYTAGGSSSISGNDASGTCADKPAISVLDEASKSKIDTGNLSSSVAGVNVDPTLSYQPVDELVARLMNAPGRVDVSGTYKGDFGSAESPGVFVVTEKAKLTGGVPEGFGIMIIRSGGELEYEGALELAGNFVFNGLIIFENAFDMKGRGTPDIRGSILVGNTPNNNSTINIDISGNIKIQYDCVAEKFAKSASANLLKQSRFIRLRTFE